MLSLLRSRLFFGSFRLLAFGATAAAVIFGPVAQAGAALLKVKTETVKGSGTNTIVSLQPNPDGTLSIQAVQEGHLTHFGKFTGAFSYVATYVPTGIQLVGSGTLTNEKGDTLTGVALISEIGSDYPFRVVGALQIVGGTGDYAGSTGVLLLTGSDTTSLTDTLNLAGEITTVN